MTRINLLVQAAVELLVSGDDEGCDGLVVVTADAYCQLQTAVMQVVGQGYGIVIQPKAD